MPREIERKFLVLDDSFKDMAYDCSHIIQGYLTHGKGRSVRIRIRDDKAFLTIKGPSMHAGLNRYEWEKEISVSDAQDLLKLAEPGRIDKHRYLVRSGEHVFEVDVFHGENEGLVMAEVELKSEDEPFVKPPFIGKEVTGDRRYYNSFLTQFPYKIWRNAQGE